MGGGKWPMPSRSPRTPCWAASVAEQEGAVRRAQAIAAELKL